MGRRKKHAPKRGSLAYLPKSRAAGWVGRIRFWPNVEGEPRLLAFPGFKAGMTHIITVDQHKGSLTFGREVSIPITVLETPPLIVCGVRLYGTYEGGLRTLGEAWSTEIPKDLERVITPPKKTEGEDPLTKLEGSIEKASEVRVIAATQPRLTGIGRKKPHLIEIKVSGGTLKEQFEYAKGLLGKMVKSNEVFKEGSFVDVVAITKGKGIQGPVKRWGVRILHHKSRKTRRGVGSIGGWTPSSIIYSVPRAGQTGFFQRTEYNKQIVKVGENGSEITPRGGFPHYGIVRGGYVMLMGSVPGAAKRLVMMRYPARASTPIEGPPKIEYLSLESKQGD
ncbi:MAG: 50S ribosomal protein L3 [Candidatus Bathyarchaeia archaeon]|nr:50S ribosomal protein L3 [Candidatus Bathyarchaeota archaeon]